MNDEPDEMSGCRHVSKPPPPAESFACGRDAAGELAMKPARLMTPHEVEAAKQYLHQQCYRLGSAASRQPDDQVAAVRALEAELKLAQLLVLTLGQRQA
jgi:hypothetical protein